MLFQKLNINYFGRFHNREIDLKPGINLIYGENEAGKSTVHTFIKGMLFGIDKLRGRASASKDDLYTRYLPWDYPGAFGGSMDIKVGDKEYRLQRSFHTSDKNFTILDLSTGREVKLKEGFISEILPGLSEATFKNTISIEQLKAQTDAELAAQVRNYIANLSITKSKEVNVAKAVSILTEKRKQFDPNQDLAALNVLRAEIEEGLAKEERMDQLTIQLRGLLSEERQLKEQKEKLAAAIDNESAKRMEQLPAILEKYHSYQELTRQENQIEAQNKELQDRIMAFGKEQLTLELLKKDMLDTQQLQSNFAQQEKGILELQRERDNLKRTEKKNLLLSILPPCFASLLLLLITGFHPVGIGASIVLLLAGIFSYAILGKKRLDRKRSLEEKTSHIEQEQKEIQYRLKDILNRNHILRIEELAEKQEELLKDYYSLQHVKDQVKDLEQRRKDIEDNRDLLYETIMKYMQYFITEEELSFTSMQKLQEAIHSRRQDTSGKLMEINQRYDSCKLRIEKLRWEISSLEGNEDQLLKNKALYDELEQKQKENTLEQEAIKLALASIQELSMDIHDSFGHQLNKEVSKVFSEVTGEKYQDLKVDEKLEVKVGWKGDYVLMDRLSAGTIDQVYFALRLAVADLLLGKDEVPLLLDDSFALYDDARVRAALKKIAKRKQIILFTCHKREQRLLDELGMDYHFIDLSCPNT